MKKFLLILLSILFFGGCSTAMKKNKLVSVELLRSNEIGYYKNISPKQVKKIMESGEEFLLIDVRTHKEYKSGHLKGAKHMPISDIEQWYKTLETKGKTILYCRGAVRSAKASKKLVENGFKSIYNMTGGIAAWDYDTVK